MASSNICPQCRSKTPVVRTGKQCDACAFLKRDVQPPIGQSSTFYHNHPVDDAQPAEDLGPEEDLGPVIDSIQKSVDVWKSPSALAFFQKFHKDPTSRE